MNLASAQADLRRAHVFGGAGVLVSGLVWFATGLIWLLAGPKTAFIALFLGGLAIAPLAQLATRFGFKAPVATTGKRLEWIGLATVPIMLAGFYLGWQRIGIAPATAIPLVAITVGLRYLTFPVMYGLGLFALLGLAFIGVGWLGLNKPFPAGNVALILGVVELIWSALLWLKWQAVRPDA